MERPPSGGLFFGRRGLGGLVRGTWTLSVADIFNGNTNTLVQWQLTVAAGRPFLPK